LYYFISMIIVYKGELLLVHAKKIKSPTSKM
jgi:hypothetical protein